MIILSTMGRATYCSCIQYSMPIICCSKSKINFLYNVQKQGLSPRSETLIRGHDLDIVLDWKILQRIFE